MAGQWDTRRISQSGCVETILGTWKYCDRLGNTNTREDLETVADFDDRIRPAQRASQTVGNVHTTPM